MLRDEAGAGRAFPQGICSGGTSTSYMLHRKEGLDMGSSSQAPGRGLGMEGVSLLQRGNRDMGSPNPPIKWFPMDKGYSTGV